LSTLSKVSQVTGAILLIGIVLTTGMIGASRITISEGIEITKSGKIYPQLFENATEIGEITLSVKVLPNNLIKEYLKKEREIEVTGRIAPYRNCNRYEVDLKVDLRMNSSAEVNYEGYVVEIIRGEEVRRVMPLHDGEHDFHFKNRLSGDKSEKEIIFKCVIPKDVSVSPMVSFEVSAVELVEKKEGNKTKRVPVDYIGRINIDTKGK